MLLKILVLSNVAANIRDGGKRDINYRKRLKIYFWRGPSHAKSCSEVSRLLVYLPESIAKDPWGDDVDIGDMGRG